MILYTSQDKRSMDILNRDGRFTNKKIYIQDHFEDIANIFIERYSWFVSEAEKIVEKPKNVHFSIWCSITAEACMVPSEDEIIYILDVPDDEIILFDGSKWDFVLNKWYLPNCLEDDEAYKKYLKSKGIKNENDIFDRKYDFFYKEEREKIVESWKRIFDIVDSDDFYIQGNIWEIKKEWIIDTVGFEESIPSKYYK